MIPSSHADRATIWPLLTCATIYVTSICVFSHMWGLGQMLGVGFYALTGLYGLPLLCERRVRRAASYLAASAIFLGLALSWAYSFAYKVLQVRHYVLLRLTEATYARDIGAMKAGAIRYQEWPWGTADGTTFTLVYDETAGVMHVGEEPDRHSPCARDTSHIRGHFSVVNDFCP